MQREDGVNVPFLEREIGDNGYRAYQLKIAKWAELTEHLANMLGKPFGTALRGGSVDMDALLDGNTAIALLALVTEKLTAKNLLKLLGLAQESLQLEGETDFGVKKPRQWDNHFQQNMGDLAPVILLFLEAQYADFFDGLKRSVPDLKTDPVDRKQSTDQS